MSGGGNVQQTVETHLVSIMVALQTKQINSKAVKGFTTKCSDVHSGGKIHHFTLVILKNQGTITYLKLHQVGWSPLHGFFFICENKTGETCYHVTSRLLFRRIPAPEELTNQGS